jgi:hypothetical protein
MTWPADLLTLQLAFEGEDSDALALAASHSDDPTLGRLASLLLLCNEGRWEEIESLAQDIFRSKASHRHRAYALHIAVSASEVNFNEERRASWLRRWNEIAGWSSDEFCLWLRWYQNSLTSFFASQLREAETRFRELLVLSERAQFDYGRTLALYHLGLVNGEQRALVNARSCQTQALELADKIGARRLRKRILAALRALGAKDAALGSLVDEHLEEGFSLLQKDKVRAARHLALHVSKIRRHLGLSRGSTPNLVLLALISARENRTRTFQLIFDHIEDPLVRIQCLSLLARLMPLSADQKQELDWLELMLGVTHAESDPLRSLGASGPSPRDVEVLIELFKAHPEGIDKEQICQGVWRLPYDPVIHDQKVYKLILKARKVIGRKDCFINDYGSYRLHPQLIQNS